MPCLCMLQHAPRADLSTCPRVHLSVAATETMGQALSCRKANDVDARATSAKNDSPIAANATATAAADTAATDPHKGSVTNQGFHSDILNEKPSHVTGLVHESSMKQFDAKYDVSGGTELGRGACGQVWLWRLA